MEEVEEEQGEVEKEVEEVVTKVVVVKTEGSCSKALQF